MSHSPDTNALDDTDEFDLIATEIIERVRTGSTPTLEEYVAKYPHCATRLKNLLPALIALEAGHIGPLIPAGMPEQLGEYRLLRVLGRGGMGTVFEANQVTLNRVVAVKVLHQHVNDAMLERFRRETRTAGKLQHPHIVPVYGVGEAEGRSFYVMRYVRGVCLHTLIEQFRKDEWHRPKGIAHEGHFRAVARWGAEIAEGLAYAHERGILHRDIKPANILIDTDSRAWITDFGLAKVIDDGEMTLSTEVVGTIRYMAPERFRGINSEHADIYALGVTLYEAVTLRAAFDQVDKQELLYAVNHTQPPRPRNLNRHIPKVLETILLKASAPKPEERYLSAREFASDLRCFLADRSIAAKRPSIVEEVLRTCRRYPAAVALASGLFLTVTFAAIFLFLQNQRLDTALETAKLNASQVEERQLDLLLSEGFAVTQGQQPGRRELALKNVREALQIASRLGVLPQRRLELRNVAAAAFAVPDMVPTALPQLGPSRSVYFAVHHDADLFATCVGDDAVTIFRLNSGEVLGTIHTAISKGDHPGLNLSNHGRYLSVYSELGSVLEVYDLHTTDRKRIAHITELAAAESLATDESQMLILQKGHGLYRLDLSTQQRTLVNSLMIDKSQKIWNLALHPTQPIVFMACYKGMRTLLINTDTGRILADNHNQEHITSAAWHPSGNVLTVTGHHDVEPGYFLRNYAWNGEQLHPLTQRTVDDALTYLAYNKSGDMLATSSWSSRVFLFDRLGENIFISPYNRDGVFLNWSGDGQRLGVFAVDGNYATWSIEAQSMFTGVLQQTTSVQQPIGMMALQPDQRHLVYAKNDLLYAGDLADGRIVAEHHLHGSYVLEYTSDGAAIVRGDKYNAVVTLGRKAAPSQDYEFSTERLSEKPNHHKTSADGTLNAEYGRLLPQVTITKPGGEVLQLHTGIDHRYVNFSRDSRYVLTASHIGTLGKLWDVATGKLLREHDLSAGGGYPAFTPDGKKLWISARGGRFLRVGTWEEEPAIGTMIEKPVFSPCGKFMVAETGTGCLNVISIATNQLVAKLFHPHRQVLIDLQFTSDGKKLLCRNANEPYGIHVWEIHELRKLLGEMDLDWTE